MKRILLAFFLLTGTVTISTVQHASAQTVTAASFTTKVDQMDAYIGAGNMTAAQSTFDELNAMMKTVLGVSKTNVQSAATPADSDAAKLFLRNQTVLYRTIWSLKSDLAANRATIRTKLQEFDLTIH